MRYLLDTHALIWWWLEDPQLSKSALRAMSSGGDEIFVSAVSAIEIALRVRTGRLPLMAEPLAAFDEAVKGDGFFHFPVTYAHARDAGLLDGVHRDPFDRLIAAQALIEDMTIVTRDPRIAEFGCRTIW